MSGPETEIEIILNLDKFKILFFSRIKKKIGVNIMVYSYVKALIRGRIKIVRNHLNFGCSLWSIFKRYIAVPKIQIIEIGKMNVKPMYGS